MIYFVMTVELCACLFLLKHHINTVPPPPETYEAQAEALDEDDFDDELYDEDDFEEEDYEEIKPQVQQTLKKPSAHRRNAQAAYDYYLPDVYASPPVAPAPYFGKLFQD